MVRAPHGEPPDVTVGAEVLLARSESVPDALTGEPWGEASVLLSFPPGTYLVSGLGEGQRRALIERYGEGPAGAGHEAPPATVELFRAEPAWFERTRITQMRIDLAADARVVRFSGPAWTALILLGEPLRAGIWLLEGPDASHGEIENALRVIAAYRLLACGGLLVHSAGVVSRGVAHLFLGQSGAGKTTLSRLSAAEGRTILSDDLNALSRTSGGEPLLSSVPFAGDFGLAGTSGGGRFPLGALFRLRKGSAFGLEPLSAGAAAGLMVANAPFLNTDPHRTDALLTLAGGLASAARRFTLTFSRDETALWERLDAALADRGVGLPAEGV